MSSPTQRSLKYLRNLGYEAQVVERWLAWAKRRLDLFGFIDIVCLCPGVMGVLGVQTTSQPNRSNRVAKALALPALQLWLQCGNAFEVHGWRKVGAAGKRKLWQVHRQVLTLDDLSHLEEPQ